MRVFSGLRACGCTTTSKTSSRPCSYRPLVVDGLRWLVIDSVCLLRPHPAKLSSLHSPGLNLCSAAPGKGATPEHVFSACGARRTHHLPTPLSRNPGAPASNKEQGTGSAAAAESVVAVVVEASARAAAPARLSEALMHYQNGEVSL